MRNMNIAGRGMRRRLMGLGMLLVVVVGSCVSIRRAAGQNVTEVLSHHPNYSTLMHMLVATGVAAEINIRSSLTLLCPDNAILDPVVAQNANSSMQQLGDVLRFHVLLQYLDMTELKNMNNGSGLVTTLYQTTGRAQGTNGFVNISDLPNGAVQVGTAAGVMQAAILTNITQYPYNYTFFQVNGVVVPDGLTTAPPATANLTDILTKALHFTTLLSLLESTGVGAALATRETGTGLVLFAPSDDAFAALPSGALAKLTAAQKVALLQYHVLTAYAPLGTLEKLSNPVSNTLATPSTSSSFTLNITAVAANVAISTGLVNTSVTNTLYDNPPVAVFSIGAVLLPKEVFARGPVGAPVPSASTPIMAPSLAPAPSLLAPPTPTPVPFALPSTPTPTSAPTPGIAPVLAPSAATPALVPVTSPPAPPASAPLADTSYAPAGSPLQPATSPNAAERVLAPRCFGLVVAALLPLGAGYLGVL